MTLLQGLKWYGLKGLGLEIVNQVFIIFSITFSLLLY
jgi:hypothetical protein